MAGCTAFNVWLLTMSLFGFPGMNALLASCVLPASWTSVVLRCECEGRYASTPVVWRGAVHQLMGQDPPNTGLCLSAVGHSLTACAGVGAGLPGRQEPREK